MTLAAVKSLDCVHQLVVPLIKNNKDEIKGSVNVIHFSRVNISYVICRDPFFKKEELSCKYLETDKERFVSR